MSAIHSYRAPGFRSLQNKLCIENILTQGDHSIKKTVPPFRGKENMAQKQNYAVKMDLLKQKKIAAGLVSDCFPEVSGMVIVMTYFRKGLNPFLMLRTVNVFPSAYAYFNMDCMISGCTDGGFDLSPVIKEMVRKHNKQKKGTLVCKGKNADVASDHAHIDYEITIKFVK